MTPGGGSGAGRGSSAGPRWAADLYRLVAKRHPSYFGDPDLAVVLAQDAPRRLVTRDCDQAPWLIMRPPRLRLQDPKRGVLQVRISVKSSDPTSQCLTVSWSLSYALRYRRLRPKYSNASPHKLRVHPLAHRRVCRDTRPHGTAPVADRRCPRPGEPTHLRFWHPVRFFSLVLEISLSGS